jgi:hypothetical protein
MTPEQWARVFKAGYEQLERAAPVAGSANSLGMALEAMSDECTIISREAAS